MPADKPTSTAAADGAAAPGARGGDVQRRYGPELDVPRRSIERPGPLGAEFQSGLRDGYRLDTAQYQVARALGKAGYSVQALLPGDPGAQRAHAIIRADGEDPGLYAQLRATDSSAPARAPRSQIRDAGVELRAGGHESYAVAVHGGPGYDGAEADRQHRTAMAGMRARGETPPAVTYHVYGDGHVEARVYDHTTEPTDVAGGHLGRLGDQFQPGVHDTTRRLDPDQTRIAEAFGREGMSVHPVAPEDPRAGNAHVIVREGPDDRGRYAQLRGTELPPSMRTVEMEIRHGANEMLSHSLGIVAVDGGPGFTARDAVEQSRIVLATMDAQGERAPETIYYLLHDGALYRQSTDWQGRPPTGLFDRVRLPENPTSRS